MKQLRARRDKFEKLSKDINLGIGSFFKKATRYTCPCCGYPTLDERGMYGICDLCNWEDDGQDDHDSSECLGGPNGGYSLNQARENFLKYKIMYSPENNTTITGGDSEERELLKEELIEVFDSMLTVSGGSLESLWKKALKIEKELYRELEKSVRDYEKAMKKP